MRKVLAFVFLICLIINLSICLSTCKPFLADIGNDLSYLTNTTTIEKAVLEKLVKDNEQIPSLSSDSDKSIIIKLNNPENYELKMPGEQGSSSDIVIFEKDVKGLKGKVPEVNSDYTLESPNSKTLKLIFKEAFLKQNEHGSVNIAPKFNLYNKEGRLFHQEYAFKLRVNSPPPALECKAIGKTQDGTKQYYVLCLEINDMDKSVRAGLLHKDISAITVTPQGGAAQNIPLTVDGNSFNISNSGGVLLPADKVEKLTAEDVTSEGSIYELPKGNEIIYFKTDVEVKGAVKEYAFKLIDQKGLSSPEFKTSTVTNKLPQVRLFKGSASDSNEIRGTDEANADCIHVAENNIAIILLAKTQPGADITGTVERKSGSSYSSVGTVSGITTAAAILPAPETNEYEVLYKITLKSNGTGYNDSDEQIFFVKLTKELFVSFKVEGGNGSLKGRYGTDEKTANGSNSQKFTVSPNGTVTFTAESITGYEVESWTVNGSLVNGSYPFYSLSDIIESKTIAVKFKKKIYTVNFSVEDGNGGSITARLDGQPINTGSSIQVPYGENVTFTAVPEENWEIEKWMFNTSVVNGTNSNYILNVTAGSTVKVKFKKDAVTITAGNDSWKKLKQEAERADGHKVIIINGEITATNSSDNFGEIVINRNLVIEGSSKDDDKLNANHTVDSKAYHRIFTVRSGKKLTLKNLTLTGGGKDINTKLDGAAIYTEGELNIKNCKFENNEAGRDTTGKGGALYINNGICTITNCEFTENSANMGGAVYVEDGECTIGTENGGKTKIYFNEATNGAAVYVASKQNSGCVINDGTIIGGDAELNCNPATGSGGGIFISQEAQCTINAGVIIKNNQAEDGAGIANYGGSLTINGAEDKKVIISHCKAVFETETKRFGGGICIKPYGTTMPNVRITHALIEYNTSYKGGGLYIDRAYLVIKNTVLTSNTATNEGGGIYLEAGILEIADAVTITPSKNADATVKGKNDIYLKDGKKITVKDTLNPEGGIAGRITPESYTEGTSVLDGRAVNTEYSKFTVTPDTSQIPPKSWYIANDGNLTLTQP